MIDGYNPQTPTISWDHWEPPTWPMLCHIDFCCMLMLSIMVFTLYDSNAGHRYMYCIGYQYLMYLVSYFLNSYDYLLVPMCCKDTIIASLIPC